MNKDEMTWDIINVNVCAFSEGWPFPCIFQTLKSQDKYLKTAAFYDWDWFDNIFNNGIPGSVDTQKVIICLWILLGLLTVKCIKVS